MSTHTDGVPPSVRSGPSVRPAPSAPPHGSGEGNPAGAAAIPPRPRRSDADTADPDAPPSDEDADGRPGPGEAGSTSRPQTPAAAGPSRRPTAAEPASAESGPSWVQQEIARRIVERRGSGTGRHARPDPAPDATPTPGATTPGATTHGAAPGSGAATAGTAAPGPDGAGTAPSDATPEATRSTPAPSSSAAAPTTSESEPPAGGTEASRAGEDDDEDDARAPRVVPRRAGSPRPRSGLMPDPYSPDGMREPPPGDGWPSAENGTGPEPPFRLAGPASRSAAQAPRGEGDSPASGSTGSTGRPARPATGTTGAKPWPPTDGAAGLPRRVPGNGWTLDRATLLGGAGSPVRDTDTDTDTRPVPSMWAPTGRRTTADPTGTEPTGTEPSGAEPTGMAPAVLDHDDYDDEDDDEDPRGPAVERTEVIWRAPGMDDEPEPATWAAIVAPPEGTPSQNPYTGARPRRFAGAPTDPEPVDAAAEETAADGPDGRRVRIVLSERRTTAHSVRPVVDVQDPGSVGTTLRNGLVNNQLGLAVRVFGVALLGLGLLPALFAAFPSIGEVSVVGLRVPWLLLGFLVYPFLFGLGWWYVRSAERVEQDFAEGVQDR